MTRIIHQRNNTRRRFLIGMVSLFALSGLVNDTQGKEQIMTTQNMTLWQAIEALAQQVPFTQRKVESFFSNVLNESRSSRHTIFLEGGEVELADGSVIAKFDLRLGKEEDDPGFMVLNIGGKCVTLGEVRQHYSELQITGIPRGGSLNDTTAHSVMLPWGKLSFSFAERNPDCLASIAFDPKKDN